MNTERPYQLTPLEELAFAQVDHPWDAPAAAQRLQQSLGWAALAAYSLAINPMADSESVEAYKLSVVDIVDDEPLIIPAALQAARRSLDDLEGNVRESAEESLAFLEVKLARISKVTEEPESAVAPDEEGEQKGSGTQSESEGEAERLAEAQRVVDRLAREGRLLAAWGREALVQFVTGLSVEKSISQDGFEPVSPAEFFVALVESLPALIPTEEFAAPAARQDRSFESLGHKIAQTIK
jgi:hypothetical protein